MDRSWKKRIRRGADGPTREGIEELRRELDEVRASVDRGEEVLRDLLRGRVPGDAPALFDFWGRVVLGEHRNREEERLLPWMEWAGFPVKCGPVVLFLEERELSVEALADLYVAFGDLPRSRDSVGKALEGFLRLTRLRTDMTADVLCLLEERLRNGEGIRGADEERPEVA